MRPPAFALLLAAIAPPAAAFAPEVYVDPVRAYGYFIGDTVTHVAIVTAPEPFAVEQASLPRPREVEYWLTLRSVEIAPRDVGGDAGYEITTVYQTFYAPLEPSRREVPAYDVRLAAEDGSSAEIAIPAFTFVTAPLRPILDPTTRDQMAPDGAYRSVPTGAERGGLAAGLAVAFVGLLGLAVHQAWPPFHTRSARPLTRAARAVRRAAAGGAGPGRDAAMYLALHRGLDAAHGRPLLAEDLAGFLAARPEFAPLGDRLSDFFTRSAGIFFGAGASGGAGDVSTVDVPGLARALAAIERGRR